MKVYGSRGFTLLETIVFIVILAVILAAMVTMFGSSLRNTPTAGKIDLSAELAQRRMELVLAQRRAAGFAGFADPCSPGPGPAECTPPTGYAVSANIAPSGASFKVVTVTVSGTWAATATALVGDY